jgi:homopolymeric O-antigen transport system ATP-binding protein
MAVAIQAQGLSKRYQIGELQSAYGTLRESLASGTRRLLRFEHRAHDQDLWALKDVSFELAEGGVLGIIGRNGAGKSTLLKILTRITTPTEGRATIRGRVGSLLEVGTGFHPELTGTENVYLNGSVLGMKRKEIAKKFPDIVEFAGVERFIETPVKRYSSGMSVRLAFAVAAHLEPEVLLIDEVLAVGDAEFQRRCLGRMEDMSQSGRTVVFVSHQMQALSQLCDRAIQLEGGQIVNDGPAGEVVAHYLQSVGGTGASRSWPDPETAPGDGNVLLRSIRVVDESGQLVDAVDVREPVGIEIGFTVRNANLPIFPKIKVFSPDGNVAFNAMDTSNRWRETTPSGAYVATAWIPGNLLNEGLTTVEAGVVSLAGMKLFARAMVRDAVSFHVQDLGEGDTARGPFAGQWKGVVRPLLDWTSEER